MRRTFNKKNTRQRLTIPHKRLGETEAYPIPTKTPDNMDTTINEFNQIHEIASDNSTTINLTNNKNSSFYIADKIEQTIIIQEANHVSVDNIFYAWRNWSIGIQQELSSIELEHREKLIESPLLQYWNLNISNWLEDVTKETKDLIIILQNSHIDISTDLTKLQQINFNVNYDEIISQIMKVTTNILSYINKTSNKCNEQSSKYKELQYLKSRINHFLVWINQEPYKKCFLVMGSLGAGKTTFIYNLLSKAPESTLFLYVKFIYTKSITDTILGQINEITGTKFSAITHFIKYLYTKYTNFKIIIVIDDYHKWIREDYTYKVELMNLIAHHSRYQNLFWIVTLHDTSYGDIHSPDNFWQRYSLLKNNQLQNDQYILDGWIKLDHLNVDLETGIHMIHNFFEKTGEEKPLFLHEWAKKRNAICELATPFFAWIYLDSRHDFPNAIDLRYIEFIEHLWSKRKQTLASIYLAEKNPRIGIEECKAVIEKHLRHITNNLRQTKKFELIYEIGDRLDEHHFILELFTRTNLLKSELKASESYLEGDKKVYICSLQVFWQFHLAVAIYSLDFANEVSPDRIFLELNNLQSSERERGILEFLLLILDKMLTNYLHAEVFSYICDHLDLYTPHIWFRAVKMERAQKLLFDTALQKVPLPITVDTIYAYMYFISENNSNDSMSSVRLQLLKPYFELIKRANLSSYYRYIVARIFNKIEDSEQLLACMYNLSGLEVLLMPETIENDFAGRNIVDDIANIALTAMRRLSKNVSEKTLKLFLKYLDNDPYVFYQKPSQNDNRYFFKEWLIKHFCTWFVSENGVKSYSTLRNNDWFNKKRGTTSFWMKKELHLALGFWYQECENNSNEYIDYEVIYETEVEEYFDLVDRLTYSDNRDKKESAFFLIRHTVPTYRKKGIRVAKEFREYLEELRDNKIFTDKYKDFYEINLRKYRVPPMLE